MGRKWGVADMGVVQTMVSAAARKFQIAIGTAIAVAIPLVSDGDVSKKDGISIGLAFLGAFALYAKKNETS